MLLFGGETAAWPQKTKAATCCCCCNNRKLHTHHTHINKLKQAQIEMHKTWARQGGPVPLRRLGLAKVATNDEMLKSMKAQPTA